MLINLTIFNRADDLQDRDQREPNKNRAKRLTSHGQSPKEIMQTNVKKLELRYLELSVVIDKAVYKTLGKKLEHRSLKMPVLLTEQSIKLSVRN